MWEAISGVIALVVVATINVGILKALGGPSDSPAGQILTTALWALQAPLAAIVLAARRDRKQEETKVAEDAGGENAFALAVAHAVKIFVLVQVTSVGFAAAIFVKDRLTQSLCDSGHQDRCQQIPADGVGAATATTLIAGGVFVIVVALIAFGVSGYRIGWRAKRLKWLGALVTPLVGTLLLLAENLLSIWVAGGDIDSSLAGAGLLSLALARAPLFAGGLLTGLVGYALSLRVNAPARRYAFAVARASRRKAVPASALKTEFLRVLGFSPDEYELVVRRRLEEAPPVAHEDVAKT